MGLIGYVILFGVSSLQTGSVGVSWVPHAFQGFMGFAGLSSASWVCRVSCVFLVLAKSSLNGDSLGLTRSL